MLFLAIHLLPIPQKLFIGRTHRIFSLQTLVQEGMGKGIQMNPSTTSGKKHVNKLVKI